MGATVVAREIGIKGFQPTSPAEWFFLSLNFRDIPATAVVITAALGHVRPDCE